MQLLVDKVRDHSDKLLPTVILVRRQLSVTKSTTLT